MKKPFFISAILGTAITFSPLSMASLLQHHISTTNDKNAPSNIVLSTKDTLYDVGILEQHLSSSGEKASSLSITRAISQPTNIEDDTPHNLIKFHIENL